MRTGSLSLPRKIPTKQQRDIGQNHERMVGALEIYGFNGIAPNKHTIV